MRDLDNLVASVFSTIIECLENGERVELRGFGVFFSVARKERIGRNPRTGAQVALPPCRVPMFRLSGALHKRLNDADADGALGVSRDLVSSNRAR